MRAAPSITAGGHGDATQRQHLHGVWGAVVRHRLLYGPKLQSGGIPYGGNKAPRGAGEPASCSPAAVALLQTERSTASCSLYAVNEAPFDEPTSCGPAPVAILRTAAANPKRATARFRVPTKTLCHRWSSLLWIIRWCREESLQLLPWMKLRTTFILIALRFTIEA
jgi:hypothetical protein